MHIINLIRAKDWLKNILIFFPLIFSGHLFDNSHYITLFIGFITFNILASCIYVINDILDIKEDKLHPIKKLTKPIASNKITLNSSYVVLFFDALGFVNFLIGCNLSSLISKISLITPN